MTAKNLIQSDGTDVLTFRDPKNFASVKTVKVTRDGAPLRDLNELEWIDGLVWANVWQTDDIVVIDPANGKVVAQLNLTGLLGRADRNGREDVLNGIAYDAAGKRLFVTGKNWSKLFLDSRGGYAGELIEISHRRHRERTEGHRKIKKI